MKLKEYYTLTLPQRTLVDLITAESQTGSYYWAANGREIRSMQCIAAKGLGELVCASLKSKGKAVLRFRLIL